MEFEFSPRVRELQTRLLEFMERHIYPNEAAYEQEIDENRRRGNAWVPLRLIEELKPRARDAGLWNMFLPHSYAGAGRHLEPRLRAAVRDDGPRRLVGRGLQLLGARHRQHGDASSATAPRRRRTQWLEPLLAGEIRSAFLMTEPAVASSDATNIQCSIRARRRRVRHQRPQVVSARAPAIRAARSSSSWARPIPTRRATRSSRWCWCRATRQA